MKRHGDSRFLPLKQHQSIMQRLQRPPGGSVEVTFRLGDGSRRTLELDCRAPENPGASLGNMPPVPIRFRTERLGDDVGYIAFDAFMDPLKAMPAFEAAVKTYRDTKAGGIVLDLRGNPGGIAGMSTGMAGWFVGEEDLSLGTMTSRAAKLQFIINPRLEPFTGRLAILIDGCSASTSEIMAGGLKDIGRARVFGTRSAGAALPSVIAKLPSGELFQYVIANFTSKDGEQLEGNGVEPDETVALTRKALLAGRDSVLEAALAWIRTR